MIPAQQSTRPLAAVAWQLATAAYLQAVEWIPMYPWNDLSKGNMQEMMDIGILATQLLIALGFFRGRLVLMCAGLSAYGIWFYLQVVGWWKPYLFGGRTVGQNWYFAHTYKFLPQIGDRPTPDANHIVLQLLLVGVLLSGGIAIFRHRSSNPRLDDR